ncbi:MAG: hypothetical protein WBF08_06635, partial [Candidatus Bathyarchaeia archaeon]
QTYSYLNDLRNNDGTDWAVTIFVAHSFWDLDGCFTDGWFGYAYLGGPFMVMTYDNDGYFLWNMEAVTAHEMGHIFYAADEYSGAWSAADPSREWGYLAVENQNSEDGGSSNYVCIMRGQVYPYSSGAVCPYTRGHVGWRDSDIDGIMDILDFYPENTMISYPTSPTSDTTPYFSGSANSRQTYPNNNPMGLGNDITINTISLVAYGISDENGNPISDTMLANPSDGSFDSSLEDWYFTSIPLSYGTYEYVIGIVNSAGNDLVFSIWVTIAPSITFQTNGVGSDASSIILAIDGISYDITQLPQSFIWPVGSSHTVSASNPINVGTDKRYVWTSWSDGGALTHTYIVPSSSQTVSANYKTRYYLTVNSPYGTVSGEDWYDSGSTAYAGLDTDTVTEDSTRRVFTQWTGDASGTDYSQSDSITIDGPKTATVEWKTQYYLTVNSEYDSPQGEGWYDENTEASFSVTSPVVAPDGNRYTCTSYSGDASGDTTNGIILMDNPKTIIFEWIQIIWIYDAESYIVAAEENNAYFIYPNYEGVKPPGVSYAWVSDWTATGFIIGMCSNLQNEATDTDQAIINANTGEPLIHDSTIVLFGGPIVNAPVNYYEKNRISPLYWRSVSGTYYWYLADGTRLDETAMPFSQISGGHQDMFVVESFVDNSGNNVFIVYGYGWKGTFAAGLFFKSIVYPNLSSYSDAWYVYRWNDSNGDEFVDLTEINQNPVVKGQ